MDKDSARNLLHVSAAASDEEIKAAYSRTIKEARERLERQRPQKKRESEKRKLNSDFGALVAELQDARETLLSRQPTFEDKLSEPPVENPTEIEPPVSENPSDLTTADGTPVTDAPRQTPSVSERQASPTAVQNNR